MKIINEIKGRVQILSEDHFFRKIDLYLEQKLNQVEKSNFENELARNAELRAEVLDRQKLKEFMVKNLPQPQLESDQLDSLMYETWDSYRLNSKPDESHSLWNKINYKISSYFVSK
jgi:hypothetical protein